MPLLFLTRHAHPDRTRIDLPYHLLPGPPLTERGEQEAAELGNFLRQARVRSILASPLERCQHTARIAAEIAGASLHIDPALGEWQPTEKADEVRQRILPVFEHAALASSVEAPLAIVTHGGPIGVLLEALGMDRSTLLKHYTYDYGNPLPTAGVWRVERNGAEAGWKLNLAFVPLSALEPISTI